MGKGRGGAQGLVVGKEFGHWKHWQKSLKCALGSWNQQKKGSTFYLFIYYFFFLMEVKVFGRI